MRATQFILTTFREDPGDAVVASHRLMLRAGLMHKLGSGLYHLLPLGLCVFRKIEAIIRQEMNAAGALECLPPILIPAELWQKSGRLEQMGKELFRLEDRHTTWNVLGPTHEEVFTDTMKYLLKSYKDLPKNVYQIHTKFRDEVRPRFGVMRSREFVMKDAYSFHVDQECLDKTYQLMRHHYQRIFDHLGLYTFSVEADSGSMGGAMSEEFMVAADIGEETILISAEKSYCSNQEKTPVLYSELESATIGTSGKKKKTLDSQKQGCLEKIHTPGAKTIKQMADLLDLSLQQILKAVLYIVKKEAVVVFLRGDREVNETKLKAYLGVTDLRVASEQESLNFGFVPGFIGPKDLKYSNNKDEKSEAKQGNIMYLLYDHSVMTQENWVIGANQKDYHYTGYVLEPKIESHDLALARAGDLSPNGDGRLKEIKGIELGHIFKLGNKYTEALGMSVLSKKGKPIYPLMGCYGIGVNRSMAAVIEQYHDEKGIRWPIRVAPYEICLISITNSDQEEQQAEEFYTMLDELGCEVLWDDRDLRPGVKFNDAELIGFPLRITMGKHYFSSGSLEVYIRAQSKILNMKGTLEGLGQEVLALRNKIYVEESRIGNRSI